MKAQGSESVDQSVTELRKELRSLQRVVDGLGRRIAALEADTSTTQTEEAPGFELEETESLWSWVGQSRFLPRIAIICFVLVVALVLRTLADSGSIPLELGVVLGMAYSACLVVWGGIGLARDWRGKTVLPACGAALMSSVVLEAHGPFGLLSAANANWILLATLVVITPLGLAYRNAAVVAFGVLAPAISALTLGFPNLPFPYTAATLFGASLAALLGAHRQRLAWLPFSTFALTLFFWLLWGFKANVAIRREEEVAANLFLAWFLPGVIAFAVLFAFAAATRAFVRPKEPGAFHVVAPTANVLWAYLAALAILVPSGGNVTALGILGVVVAALHFGIAGLVWRRVRECALGTTAFAVAGTALLAIAVVSATGDLVFALPIWAVVALGLGILSGFCGNPTLRGTAYALQGLACVLAVAGSAFAVPSGAMLQSLVAASVLTIGSAVHFRWMCAHGPPEGALVTRIDPSDRNTIGLLWIAAINAFLLLRLIAYAGIDAAGIEIDNAFPGTQSVIINLASIGLMWWGLRKHDRDILGTAVLVAAAGGIKVFVSDMQNTSGIPLVLAVFSFGLAAAVGSVVLGKWQTATSEEGTG